MKLQELTCEVQSVKRVKSRTASRTGDDDGPASPSGTGSALTTMPPATKRPGSGGATPGGPSAGTTPLTTSRPTSKGGRVHKGNALSWNELVSSERAKVAAMLQQLDNNNREIEGQRYGRKALSY